MHGGVKKEDLGSENVDAVTLGCKNLEKHVENINKFGVPVVVAINDYVSDTEKEHNAIINFCKILVFNAKFLHIGKRVVRELQNLLWKLLKCRLKYF